MSTTTTPATTASSSKSTFIEALISVGASLGSAFLTNPAIASLITLAATTTNSIITAVQAAKNAAPTGSGANPLVVPIFIAVLQAALAAAVAEGKISAADAATLNKAIAAVSTEDAIAKTIVDYTTIGPIGTV